MKNSLIKKEDNSVYQNGVAAGELKWIGDLCHTDTEPIFYINEKSVVLTRDEAKQIVVWLDEMID